MEFSLTPLFLLAVVAGYRFIKEYEGTRYRLPREEGHALYFDSAFYGLIIFLVTLFLVRAAYAGTTTLSQHLIPALEHRFFSLDSQALILIALFVAPLLSGVMARLANKYTAGNDSYFEALKNNNFEWMLVKAVESNKMVMVTMEDEKVYIGLVCTPSDPLSRERRSFSLIPFISGYRRTDTRKVCLTTFYQEVFKKTEDEIQHLNVADFVVVLPMHKILSGRIFDLQAYEAFQQQTER